MSKEERTKKEDPHKWETGDPDVVKVRKKKERKPRETPETIEKTFVITEPTIKVELHRVIGGRAPKTEVTAKISGDLKRVNEELLNNRYKEVFIRIRKLFVEELEDLDSELRKSDDKYPK